jgi:hypothetical protein
LRLFANFTTPVARAFGRALFALTWFNGCLEIENVHPVEGGALRMKCTATRRGFRN